MELAEPYFFTSPRTMTLVDQAQMAPAEGPLAEPIYGYHTLWAAEVPFIPASMSGNGHDFDAGSTHRISQTVQRQVRFLYDLAQSRENLATFELRLVAWPQGEGLAQVGIAFLGKIFHPNEQMSRRLAQALWEKFNAVFPREVPFSYPLIPVHEQLSKGSAQTHSFQQWHEPIPFARLNQTASIIELRKYEDWPTLRNIGGVYYAHDYIPHPFVPALDHSAMARLFETMAHQKQVCIVAITIRPQQLTDQEELMLYEHAGWFEKVASGETKRYDPLAETMNELSNEVFDAYPRAHAELGLRVYNVFKRESRSLFSVRLQVIGDPAARSDLIEALGSEVMANAGNAHPSRWSRIEAADASEFRWALFNLQWLEFVRWSISPLILQSRGMIRLRQLATALEVSGAFRLPVAPNSGTLAGVEVRDEPFSSPIIPLSTPAPCIYLGKIMDRGVSTEASCSLSLAVLAYPIHMFGEASRSQEQVLQTLLNGASAANIPWLVFGDLETSIHRAAFPYIKHICVDAAYQGLNLPFHPLLPPPGIALPQFIDAVIRVWSTICMLDTTAVSLLRRAFLSTYERAGWAGGGVGRLVTLAELAAAIAGNAEQTGVFAQGTTNARIQSLQVLQDLLTTVPQLDNAPYLSKADWSEPLHFDFGWLGSDISRALLRGWCWAWSSLALTTAPVAAHALRAVLVLTDAHTLLGTAGNRRVFTTGSSFSAEGALPATVSLIRQFNHEGVGTILVDSSPERLPESIMSSARLTVLTESANRAAQEYVARFIGASSQQVTRIHHLRPGEAVIAIRGINPVLLCL